MAKTVKVQTERVGMRECDAIRAERYKGHGTATVTYFARSAGDSDVWMCFRKKDNPHIAYPKLTDADWGDWFQDKSSRYGTQGMYWSETQRTRNFPIIEKA